MKDKEMGFIEMKEKEMRDLEMGDRFETVSVITKSYNKWVDGSVLGLWITGYSGSGKSTLAKHLAMESGATHVDFDSFMGDRETQFRSKLPDDHVNTKSDWASLYKLVVDDLLDLISEFTESKTQFIIEGIILLELSNDGYEDEIIEDIINTSAIMLIDVDKEESTMRATLRNDDEIDSVNDGLEEPFEMFKDWLNFTSNMEKSWERVLLNNRGFK